MQKNIGEAGSRISLQIVRQEHALGCGVACVAARLGIAYPRALRLFSEPENAWTRGFFCEAIVAALGKGGLRYGFDSFRPDAHSHYLRTIGTIVYVEPSAQYAAGHYLVRASEDGWMNSWANSPALIPIIGEIQRDLPGRTAFVIFELR